MLTPSKMDSFYGVVKALLRTVFVPCWYGTGCRDAAKCDAVWLTFLSEHTVLI